MSSDETEKIVMWICGFAVVAAMVEGYFLTMNPQADLLKSSLYALFVALAVIVAGSMLIEIEFVRKIIVFISILCMLAIAIVFINISINGARGWSPGTAEIASYIAVIVFFIALYYAEEKYPAIKIIREKADKLLDKMIISLWVFFANYTVWLGITLVGVVVFRSLLLYLDSDFSWNLFKQHEIIGELMLLGALIIPGILAKVKPLVTRTPEEVAARAAMPH